MEQFEVFAPKALAGIGRLPDTIADRSLPIRLKRRAPDERVERLRERVVRAQVEPLRLELSALATAVLDELRVAAPDLPDELDDRAQDACEPLIAIADLAAADWPARARAALIALRGGSEDNEAGSLGLRLLADLRLLFNTRGDGQVATAELLGALRELEEGPWQDLARPLTPRSLASLLRPYGVRPHDLRTPAGTLKGYRRADLEDVWRRYLSSERSETPSAVIRSRDKRDNRPPEPVPGAQRPATPRASSRDGNGHLSLEEAAVAVVAAREATDAAEQALCPYPSHRGFAWLGRDGRWRCGVCHPPAPGAEAA